MSSEKNTVLFICLGNICRSQIIEAVFLNPLKLRGLRDQRTVDTLRGSKIELNLLGSSDPNGESIIS
ncbi:uncharacterized protein in rpcF 3'region-like [Schistocerca piceifrons]|uniref:uncharacterized protein in rpcF 3'region-like n=1 Tax=Schistocerca piceifrons TaxID=274613 RepID=UPI001F5FBFEE|nr:uncharacterized protein in rpcF 3'region-like [Schistocerca piceifrons]